MKTVNVKIRSMGDRFATGGFFLVSNADPELVSRTPKFRPREVITVPENHWLNGRDHASVIEVTEEAATRPFSYANATDALEHTRRVNQLFVAREDIIKASVNELLKAAKPKTKPRARPKTETPESDNGEGTVQPGV